jgi:hypothetical protein
MDLTDAQRSALRELCKIQTHPAITPEILRELAAARAAAQALAQANSMQIAGNAAPTHGASDMGSATMQTVGTGMFVYGQPQRRQGAQSRAAGGRRGAGGDSMDF